MGSEATTELRAQDFKEFGSVPGTYPAYSFVGYLKEPTLPNYPREAIAPYLAFLRVLKHTLPGTQHLRIKPSYQGFKEGGTRNRCFGGERGFEAHHLIKAFPGESI